MDPLVLSLVAVGPVIGICGVMFGGAVFSAQRAALKISAAEKREREEAGHGAVQDAPRLDPLTAAESRAYAGKLRRLLAALDREIVEAALIGDREPDLLHTERQEVDRVRELLDGWVRVTPQCLDLRGRGLAVLDAFASDLESSAGHAGAPFKPLAGVSVCGAPHPSQAPITK